MLAYICACCGGFGHAATDSVDTGTDLTCDGCSGHTVVELHSVEHYKKACALEEKLRLSETQVRDLNTMLANAQDERDSQKQRALDAEAQARALKQVVDNVQIQWDTAMTKERDAAVGLLDEIRKDFALHSCPPENRFCWRCEALKVVEARLAARTPAPKTVCDTCGDRHPPEEPCESIRHHRGEK